MDVMNRGHSGGGGGGRLRLLGRGWTVLQCNAISVLVRNKVTFLAFDV